MTTSVNLSGRVPEFDVSDRVRKARESVGMQQGELAERAGMARSGVARIESGKGGKPRRSSLIAIAFATGVDLAWLETGKTPDPDHPDGGSELLQLDSNQQPFD